MSDKEFWENFYSNKKGTLEPSPFAQFVNDEYSPSGTFLELGCGNGRDSLFFADQALMVHGIDQCQTTISRLNELKKEGCRFDAMDFTDLTDLGTFDHIYSRFTLHSVTQEQASRTLAWAFQALYPGGHFYIEVRSIHDELYGQGTEVEPDAFVTDHYRRFVRIEALQQELEQIGFEIQYAIESKGLAVYKEEDPAVIRIVASR